MDWNNSHPQAMDGLEQCPSLTLPTTVCKIQFYIYPADWNFPADECNAIFHVQQLTETFPADNNWRTGTFPAEMKQLVADTEGICF
jgi:hypothetical protein